MITNYQEEIKDRLDNALKENNLKFISNSAEKIRVDYRNPSSHVNVINSVKVSECLAYVIDISKILIRYMDILINIIL